MKRGPYKLEGRERRCAVCDEPFTAKFPSDTTQTCGAECFSQLQRRNMTGTTRLNQKPWSLEARQRHCRTMKRVWAKRKRNAVRMR